MGSVRLPKWHYQSPLGETLPVRGNGMTLGLTDGSVNLAIFEKSGDGVNGAENLFGSYIGTTAGSNYGQSGGLGVTTNSDKSGIVAENNAPVDHFVWCIQVFNAATALSEQESAQLVSEMQTKAQTDLANVTDPVQSFKDMSRAWGMPDYSAGVTIAQVPFTAPSDGVVIASLAWSSSERYATVNGYRFIDQLNRSESGQKSSGMIIVNKGDQITINTANIAHFTQITFFPMKGA